MPLPGSCIYSDIICKFVHAHARSRAGKGSCVQISFNFHLMGLVFLDLESRCKDRPMISIFGNVHCACYLLSNAWWITHIHTYCLGMWKYIHVDIDQWRKESEQVSLKVCHQTLGWIFSPSTSLYFLYDHRDYQLVSGKFPGLVTIVQHLGNMGLESKLSNSPSKHLSHFPYA